MSDLVEFLRARVDEDAAYARCAMWEGSDNRADWSLPCSATVDVGGDTFYAGDRDVAQHVARHDPARVLAEVAAKRAIVALHGERDGECMSCAYGGGFSVRYDDHPCDTLRHLAAVYAGHVDYRAEWAPADVGVEG